MKKLEQLELDLQSPENKKYSKYLNSFWSLTDDEQDSVRSKHAGLNAYLNLFEEIMRLQFEMLQKALEASGPYGVHGSVGGALQIEDLETTLKLVTYDEKHLRLT